MRRYVCDSLAVAEDQRDRIAAGLAALDVLEREGLQSNAERVRNYMKEKLVALGKSHAAIGDVRGAGLFIGVDLVRDWDTR